MKAIVYLEAGYRIPEASEVLKEMSGHAFILQNKLSVSLFCIGIYGLFINHNIMQT